MEAVSLSYNTCRFSQFTSQFVSTHSLIPLQNFLLKTSSQIISFTMHVSFLFNALTLSLLVGANPLPRIQRRGAALPPKYTVNELDGFANQTSFPQVYRDNGGGGNINGVNLVVFSDTSITANGAGRFGPLEHFVSNSVAAMQYVGILFTLIVLTNKKADRPKQPT
jgi:hypothetical protein